MTGVICVNKPSGITSFGVCARLRAITGEKKCGHTGTLDPMATGVLPVLLGGATRFLDFLPESDKGYHAKFTLGKTTDTLDITGKVTATYEVNVSRSDVERALRSFRGKIKQTPPMYSAVSVNGKRLYELALRGEETERVQREVEIKHLELTGCDGGEYTLNVICSKGTYIRSLIDDLGKALGCGAVMTALERTLASGFTLDDCVELEELRERKNDGSGIDCFVIPVEKVLEPYGAVKVTDAQGVRFRNGGALDAARIKTPLSVGKIYRVYDKSGFIGLGQAEENTLKTKRLFINR